MSHTVSDFYSGFEGEPEIRFVSNGPSGTSCVRVWDGYFNAILDQVRPELEGWTGLALPYHLHEGWYDQSPWTVPDVDNVIQQLESTRAPLAEGSELDRASIEVLDAILTLLQLARRTGATVTLEYD